MGDRRLSKVLVEAHRLGCRFDGWSDQFKYDLWIRAFDNVGLDVKLFNRKKEFQEPLPWSFIETGVSLSHLWEEYQKSLRGEPSPPCSSRYCNRCGICDGEKIFLRENGSDKILSIKSEGRSEIRKSRNKWRYKIVFTKKGDLSYISHLELSHLFYRALKRAELPISYSQGFHPMPRIIFAKALPVGIESLSESVDIELERRIPPDEVKNKLNQNLPKGIEIIEAILTSPFTAPTQSFRSVYLISLDHIISKDEANLGIQKVMERSEFLILQKRKGRTREIDVRPLIERMDLKEEDSGLFVELVIRDVFKISAKPLEIIEAVLNIKGEDLFRCRVTKIE
jgi:radical SAM-linked protein